MPNPDHQSGVLDRELNTLASILRTMAESQPHAPALLGLDRPGLSYQALFDLLTSGVRQLNRLGVGRQDRLAILLPNGPEMAACFLVAACTATSAPLNPAYSASELDFYLSDIGARAVIVPGEQDLPARQVAKQRGIAVLDLYPDPAAGAGAFSLDGPAQALHATPGFAEPDDIALLLHTSGTTARPKMTPLTHANLCASARHIRSSLSLTPGDRCLNVMPLFHIHGLVGVLLASLSAGASVVCTPGFDAARFFEWLVRFQPTWYSAVPTMHQAILAQAEANRQASESSRLRLVRSSSASLPPSVMVDLEHLFHAPVIEAYGMTEAAHQMASNPLPPAVRKPGSVGLPAGPQIAIFDSQGNPLLPGARGEICIRGPNVMAGYLGNPQANENAFHNGWFRTGDEGYFDADGYLYITGRLKEMINRGGEKVAPREVDEALLEHPAVAQAVTFAIPHHTLGEDVAAAVVLKAGHSLTELEMRRFLLDRLSAHKTPTQVVFLDQIPKGPTGKLQRIGLAEKLAHLLKLAYQPPQTPSERQLADIWQEVLRLDQVGRQDNFFALGGDSLLAMRLVARINETCRLDYPLGDIFRYPRLLEQAQRLESLVPAATIPRQQDSAPIPLSSAQGRLWFTEHLYQGAPLNNRPLALRIFGELNPVALQAAIDTITQRHVTLRTTIQTNRDGIPYAVIEPQARLLLRQINLDNFPLAARWEQTLKMALREAQTPLTLAPPMARAVLYRLSPEEHFLLIVFHHLIFDAWSALVFVSELRAAYVALAAGRMPSLPELPIEYSDYAAWQAQKYTPGAMAQGDDANAVDFWRGRLSNLPPLALLQPDRATGGQGGDSSFLNWRASSFTLPLSGSTVEALQALARQSGATLFMALLSVFQALLSACTSSPDVRIGTLVSGRQYPETQGLIGLFINTLVLNTTISPDLSFRQFLKQQAAWLSQAYQYQDFPFEQLVHILNLPRQWGKPLLFQVAFNMENLSTQTLSADDIPVAEESGVLFETFELDDQIARFDLLMEINPASQDHKAGLLCRLVYKVELFEPATIEGLARAYIAWLDQVAGNPDLRLSELSFPPMS